MKWRYKPLRDHFQEAALGISGLGAVTLAWSQMMSPFLLGCGIAFGAAAYYMKTEPHRLFKGVKARPSYVVDAPDAVTQRVEELAKKMDVAMPGVFETPNDIAVTMVYRGDAKSLTPRQLAFVARKHAQANLSYNFIEYSTQMREDLMERGDPALFDFVMAHELAHLKAKDATAIHRVAYDIGHTAGLPLAGLAAFTAAMNVLSTGKMDMVGFGLASSLVIAAHWFALIACSYGQKLEEYRADRNALWAIGSRRAVYTAMNILDPQRDLNLWQQIKEIPRQLTATHPTRNERLASIDRAWAEIEKFNKVGNSPR